MIQETIHSSDIPSTDTTSQADETSDQIPLLPPDSGTDPKSDGINERGRAALTLLRLKDCMAGKEPHCIV